MTPRILVVGDLILDRYLHGSIKRVNPEAPGVVFTVNCVENRLGGAGAVAYLCAGLGCSVCLMCSIGDDEPGETAKELARQAGIRWHGWHGQKQTTVKERRVSGGRLLHDRTDYDCDCLDSSRQAWLNAAGYEQWDAIIVSDYGRGVVHPTLVANLRKACPTMPVIVDPLKSARWSIYEGASVIKCNMAEAAEMDHVPDGCRLVITDDGNGMYLDGKNIPTQRKQVVDVTGCGDTVSAVLGWKLAQGVDMEQSCRLANKAAGLQVQRLGVQPIRPDEIESDGKVCDVVAFVERARQDGKRIVFTNGCYDVFHFGHLATLKAARALGDVLIVAINSDSSVKRLKGDSRPIHTQEQRAAVLSALKCVDAVEIFDGEPTALVKSIRPDVLVKGEDYRGRPISGSEYAGRVELLPIVGGLSTTGIESKLGA